MSILDQLVITAGKMPTLGNVPGESSCLRPNWKTQVDSSLALPFVLSRLEPAQVSVAWDSLLGIMDEQGIAVRSTLASVQTTSTGYRIGVRPHDEGFTRAQLTKLDAIELSNENNQHGEWAWPAEIVDGNGLRGMVAALRSSMGSEAPIGVSLPAGAHESDIRTCVASGVDFISIVDRHSQEVTLVALATLAKTRRVCEELNLAFPAILADLPIRSTEDAMKCMAMGARLVSVDYWIQKADEELQRSKPKSPAGTGMLRGIAAVPADEPPAGETFVHAIGELSHDLAQLLHFTGKGAVAELDLSILRTTNADLARALGVDLL